ncbi:hypothetical protein F5051DRAFT_442288 [Lentinula edodes]|nr:hypothetical protein F5051DRAFT_442288 [Lentinula edodes]
MSFACSNSQGGHFHLSAFQPMLHHTSQPSLRSGGEKSRLNDDDDQEAQDIVNNVRVEDPEENKTHQSRFAYASWADVPTVSAHQKGRYRFSCPRLRLLVLSYYYSISTPSSPYPFLLFLFSLFPAPIRQLDTPQIVHPDPPSHTRTHTGSGSTSLDWDPLGSTSLDSDPLGATPIASYEAGREGFDKFEDFDGQGLNMEVWIVAAEPTLRLR